MFKYRDWYFEQTKVFKIQRWKQKKDKSLLINFFRQLTDKRIEFEYMNVKKMKYESILFFNQNSKFYLSNEIYIIMKYIG